MALLNRKYNFLFIHIYKTGGMAVRKALADNIKDGYDENLESAYQGHCIAKDMKIILNDYNKLFKFAFVRNPYAWLASIYFYIRAYNSHGKHNIISDNSIDWFIDWFIDEMQKKAELGKNIYTTLSGFIYEDNKLIVDYVGKMENFQNDMDYIMSKIDLNWIKGSTQFSEVNSNPIYDKNKIMKYYSPETIKKIQKVFESDFINFNYNMEL